MPYPPYPDGIKRMADYVGRRCTMRKDVETQGGTVFKKGTVMEITGHYRGRLTLEQPGTLDPARHPADGIRLTLRQAWRQDIELLPKDDSASGPKDQETKNVEEPVP